MSKPRRNHKQDGARTLKEAAAIAARECEDFAAMAPGKTANFTYLMRLESPTEWEGPVYKIGHASVRGESKAGERRISTRIEELSRDYGCCIEREPSHIIVVMLARSSGRQDEHLMHTEMKPYRLAMSNRKGGKRAEIYKPCTAVYDKFKEICRRMHPKSPVWESNAYVLGDDGGETWIGETITDPEVPPEEQTPPVLASEREHKPLPAKDTLVVPPQIQEAKRQSAVPRGLIAQEAAEIRVLAAKRDEATRKVRWLQHAIRTVKRERYLPASQWTVDPKTHQPIIAARDAPKIKSVPQFGDIVKHIAQ